MSEQKDIQASDREDLAFLFSRRKFLEVSSAVMVAASLSTTSQAQGLDFNFDGKISRHVLQCILSRAVTHVGLCAVYPEASTNQFDDDLRMLTHIGAKFIGRAAYAWRTTPDDDAHFRAATERAAAVHKADPQIVLQACVFEAIYSDVSRIPIPDWVFEEFRLPVQKRNFRYEAMLYDAGSGDLHDHWERGGSVPDMTKLETQMWFYYRARRYIDAGFEALHFGQVELMDHNDPEHLAWQSMLLRVRRYAREKARRHWVLCDAHTHGETCRGRELFDFHAYPMCVQERRGHPEEGELRMYALGSIYGDSRGGVTPSGWPCDSLPFIVELDSNGVSPHPGKPGQPGWMWGYDEICWFARQPEAYRNSWLKYADSWLRAHDPNGWVQMPTRRNLAVEVGGGYMYQANTPSPGHVGFNQEETIKAILDSRR